MTAVGGMHGGGGYHGTDMMGDFAIRSTVTNYVTGMASSYFKGGDAASGVGGVGGVGGLGGVSGMGGGSSSHPLLGVIFSLLSVTLVSKLMSVDIFGSFFFGPLEKMKRLFRSLTEKRVVIKSERVISNEGVIHQQTERHAYEQICAITEYFYRNKVYSDESKMLINDSRDCDGDDYRSSKDIVLDRRVSMLPTSMVIHNGMKFFYTNNTTFDKDGKVSTRQIIDEMTIYAKDVNTITVFIDKCFKEWVDANYSDEDDKKRYIYIPNYDGTDGDLVYKRYEIARNKTFANIFIPEKDAIIERLDNLKNKTGVYSLKGMIRREGFCLEGEKGSGKTTLAKVIAEYTDRDIVCIDIEKIMDGKQLSDLVHNDDILCKDSGDIMTFRSDRRKRVYLLDDVDANNPIVCKRNSNDSSLSSPSEQASQVHPNAVKMHTDAMLSMARLASKLGAGKRKGAKMGKGKKSGMINSLLNMPEFTLNQFLTIIDGPLELQDAIFIMTTNEIEKLDPALLRPGRFGFQITFKKMRKTEICQFMKFHFNFDATGYDVQDYVITASELEDFCKVTLIPEEIMKMVLSKSEKQTGDCQGI